MSATATAPESRVKKTLLNARVNTFFYLLTLILSFFSRKIFLNCLGADFVGLTGTLLSVLGYLNLAELGIGTAIGYVLYKPVFDHDTNKINEIVSVWGFLFRNVGYFVMFGGIILSLFLPLIFPHTDFPLLLIYFAYYSFLGASLIGYFINYRQGLLNVDQKGYIITRNYQTLNIVKTILQMASAYYTGSYYLWVLIEFSFGIIYAIILNIRLKQTYPWLKADTRLGKKIFKKYPEVMKYTKQVFIHKLAYVLTSQSNNIVIYAFANLAAVANFGNYMMLAEKIISLITNASGSLGAGLGNLVAEGNTEKTRKIYIQVLSFQNYVSGILLFGMIAYSTPFIKIWLGDEYVLSLWVLMPFFLKTYISMGNSVLGQGLYVHGLFYDVWAPFVEAAIFWIFAIAFGFKYGLFGVLLGHLIATIAIPLCWKSYFLFKKGLHLKWSIFWIHYIKYIIVDAVVIIASVYLNNIVSQTYHINSWLSVILNMICGTVLFAFISGIIFYFIDSYFRDVIKRFLLLAKSKICK